MVHSAVVDFLSLRASAAIHLHLGQLAEDDVLVGVQVEHVDPAHLLRGAARVAVGLLEEVGPRVGGHHDAEGAVAGAEIGLVLGRVDDPLPAELLLEVDGEGPEAAVLLRGVGRLRADLVVEVPLPPVVGAGVLDVELQERGLEKQEERNGSQNRVCGQSKVS